jgi:hypothetical protein
MVLPVAVQVLVLVVVSGRECYDVYSYRATSTPVLSTRDRFATVPGTWYYGQQRTYAAGQHGSCSFSTTSNTDSTDPVGIRPPLAIGSTLHALHRIPLISS